MFSIQKKLDDIGLRYQYLMHHHKSQPLKYYTIPDETIND